jgi:hypothetical protein
MWRCPRDPRRVRCFAHPLGHSARAGDLRDRTGVRSHNAGGGGGARAEQEVTPAGRRAGQRMVDEMRIFESDGKINFVDENDVFLGYDMNQDCCEFADWFVADEPHHEMPDAKHDGAPDLTGFVFDTAYFQKIDGGAFDDGGMAIFRIVNGTAQKFIHIFNVQNGYYGHGFDFGIGKSVTCSGRL